MNNNLKDTSTMTTRLVNSQNNNVPFDEIKLKIKRNLDYAANKQHKSNASRKDMLAESNIQNLFKSISTKIDRGQEKDADKISDTALKLHQFYANHNIDLNDISHDDLLKKIDPNIIKNLTPEQQENAFKASGFIGDFTKKKSSNE